MSFRNNRGGKATGARLVVVRNTLLDSRPDSRPALSWWICFPTIDAPTDRAKAYFHALLLGQELEQQRQKQVVPGTTMPRAATAEEDCSG
jgi:hypothetical protein